MKLNNYTVGESVLRPWGSWKVDEVGDGFVKKTITVSVGGCLSLQSHKHRSECWIIVQGRAEVTLDEKVFVAETGTEINIPVNVKHRLKNVGENLLIVSEIQTGEILDEDDIVRYSDIYNRDKTVFIADMDGTLTPARLPMEKEFADFFEDFLQKHIFYVISGSDLKKVEEQLPQRIINKCAGIYCSMGNEFYQKGQLIYQNSFSPESSLIENLQKYRSNTKYPGELFDNYIEQRVGMINFSVIGRDCPQEARVQYKTWDDGHKEREKIAEDLSRLYPDYDISVGGNISIDIVPHGFGKEQVVEKLRKIYPYEKIVFLGDRTMEGGNDYSIAQELLKLENTQVVQVQGPEDTCKFLRDFPR
ncbi:MAG: HAD-IIB family hydrolase [Alphaproteobacteria bacterium]|nr:HAD-IIB family hydrolase [Alphaproteobacteria bacterium]